MWYRKSLEQLVADQFPLKSTEYSPGTPAYNEYITVIEKVPLTTNILNVYYIMLVIGCVGEIR